MGIRSEVVTGYRALGETVVVRRTPPPSLTAGGLEIPQTAQRNPRQCTVVDVGPGYHVDTGEVVPPEVRVGDEVITMNHRDVDMQFGGDKLAALNGPADIIAVVDPSAEGGHRALGSRLVIRRLGLMEKSESGLVDIPDCARENRRLARVLSAGRGRVTAAGVLIPPRVKTGDLVITVKMTGTEIDPGDPLVQVIDESQCMCTVTVEGLASISEGGDELA